MTAVPDRDEGTRPPGPAAARAALDLLGLSTRAGALVSGTDSVRSAAREGKIHHVVLAADAAEGQRRKLLPLLDARRISYSIGFTRAELGAATGRPPVSAIGISNRKLASRVRDLIAALQARP